jgi:hypothetical protein
MRDHHARQRGVSWCVPRELMRRPDTRHVSREPQRLSLRRVNLRLKISTFVRKPNQWAASEPAGSRLMIIAQIAAHDARRLARNAHP